MNFLRPHGEKLYAAIDIGTSSVSAIIFSLVQEKGTLKPFIKNLYRISLKPQPGMDGSVLARKVVEGVEELAHTILKETHNSFSTLYVGLSAPFYVSRTIHVQAARKNPRNTITKEEIEALIKGGEQDFLKTHSNENGTLDLITRIPIRTLVNGYLMEDPVGARGARIDISVRYEATTKELLQRLETPFSSRIPHMRVQAVSVPQVSFSAMRRMFDTNPSIMFIDIGGEVTEVSIISEGMLNDVLLVPIGNNNLLRHITETFKTSYNNAEFILKAYVNDTLEESEKKKVAALIDEAARVWGGNLEEGLAAPNARVFSPSVVYLAGGGARIPQYKALFDAEFRNRMRMAGEAQVISLSPSIFEGQFYKYGYFEGPEDFTLACLALQKPGDIL